MLRQFAAACTLLMVWTLSPSPSWAENPQLPPGYSAKLLQKVRALRAVPNARFFELAWPGKADPGGDPTRDQGVKGLGIVLGRDSSKNAGEASTGEFLTQLRGGQSVYATLAGRGRTTLTFTERPSASLRAELREKAWATTDVRAKEALGKAVQTFYRSVLCPEGCHRVIEATSSISTEHPKEAVLPGDYSGSKVRIETVAIQQVKVTCIDDTAPPQPKPTAPPSSED